MRGRSGWRNRATWMLLVAGSVLGPATARAEAPKAARWVPEGALIYVELTNPGQVIDQLRCEPVQAVLGAVPGYRKAFESDGFKQLLTVVDVIAEKLDTTAEKLARDLTGGGVVLAIDARAGKEPNTALLITPTDPNVLKRAVETLVELARKDAESKGNPDPFKPAEYRGTTAYAAGPKAGFAIVEGVLVFGDRGDTVKAIVDRALDGPKAGASILDNADWKARRAQVGPDDVAWSFIRLGRLRELDPKKFGFKEVPPPVTFLFGSWVEALRKTPWISAKLVWNARRLGADIELPTPPGGFPESLKGYVPPKGSMAPPTLQPPGTIASLGLWRDFSTIWESRAELLTPEQVQNLAKLDTFAGQFFGGRDFGSGVLGAVGKNWRLVVAHQDYAALKPAPDVKLPAFALVADLNPDDAEFAQRLKAAFQSFVGLSNLGAAQKTKAPPLMLGSEAVGDVTILTARYLPAEKNEGDAKEPVNRRHNFSPSAAQVNAHFILSSTTGLARDLVKTLKQPVAPTATPATLNMIADGSALARLVDANRNHMVMQNMLDKGNDKTRAEGEIGTLSRLLRYFGQGKLSIQDNQSDIVRIGLHFNVGGEK